MHLIHKPLREQTMVITGASSGIGLAAARMAAEDGVKLVVVARGGEALADLVAEIEGKGGHATSVVADVGVKADVERIVQTAVTTYGGFDTWVNVAGQTIYGRLWEVSDEDHARLMQTNFWGTVHGSLAAVEHLKENGGALINVGSVASDFGLPMQGMYAASKHAAKGFTDSLRMELLQDGIPVSVTLIKPASVDTPLPGRARNYMGREPSLPPPAYRPEEVARAILHAAVTPQRDIYVGGTGRALTLLNQFAPSLYDLLAPVTSAGEKKDEPPNAPQGTLHTPGDGGTTRGEAPFVMPASLYTRANLQPFAPGVVMAAGISALSQLLSQRRKKG